MVSWSIAGFSRIKISLLALFAVVCAGVIGYVEIEGFTVFEAFYMTVITISTVGFNEIKPLSDAGRLFTAILIMTSFGIFAYAISAISSYVMTGELGRYFKDKKVNKTIGQLKNHVIVCGYGRNGHRAVEEFLAHKTPFVIIESDKSIIERLVADGDAKKLFIEGDSREDPVLLKANIEFATALISTLPDDADNLLTVLTARELNKRLKIISRASQDTTYHKLKLAGADNVIMPDKMGGAQMAAVVLKPDVIEFFDQIIMQDPEKPYLKEVLCSNISGDEAMHTIEELKRMNKTGVSIIGMKSEDGDYVINPSQLVKLKPGTKLFVLGNTDQISSL